MELGELRMTGNVVPLSRHDSSGEKRTRLTEEDIRLITELGNKLIEDGKASAIRRFTGDSGEDVMVILDDKGVIEFGIEKSATGYKGFNCDCDTVARARDLSRLLSRFP
jgi:hypothetical protein